MTCFPQLEVMVTIMLLYPFYKIIFYNNDDINALTRERQKLRVMSCKKSIKIL